MDNLTEGKRNLGAGALALNNANFDTALGAEALLLKATSTESKTST
jgi:hypothetical protein